MIEGIKYAFQNQGKVRANAFSNLIILIIGWVLKVSPFQKGEIFFITYQRPPDFGVSSVERWRTLSGLVPM